MSFIFNLTQEVFYETRFQTRIIDHGANHHSASRNLKFQNRTTDQHPLTAVSCIVLMSFVMIQLIELRSQGKVPNNLSPEEQKITEFLLKKSQSPDHAPYLRVFLQKIREQLIQVTQVFHRERVPQDYPAKNKLIELYDYLLRDSLMLHPTCPFFAAKKDHSLATV